MNPITVHPNTISDALRALFSPEPPGVLRLHAVFNGAIPSLMWMDDLHQPTWAVVQEQLYGTLYFGGLIEHAPLSEIVHQRQQSGEVLFGYWASESHFLNLLPKPMYSGDCIDFTDRVGDLTPLLAPFPAGCEVRLFDAELLPQSADYGDLITQHGSIERVLENWFGVALLCEGEIAAEASAGLAVDDVIEVGVATREAHRGKGYATQVCAHLLQLCEARGYRTYWNTNTSNIPSVKLARKLGYQLERPYHLAAWW